MTTLIQPARPEQLPDLKQFLTQNKLPVEDLPSDLSDFWLAHDGKKLIGSVGLEVYGYVGLLRSLAVDTDYRNQAVAYQLCDRAFGEAKKKGITALYLITTTADRYFQRLGFELVDRAAVPDAIAKTSQFSGVCPSSAIVMKQKQGI